MMNSTEAPASARVSEAKFSLKSLVDLLESYRGWLVGVYAVLLTGWVALFLYTDLWIFPEAFAAIAGYRISQDFKPQWEGVGMRIVAVVVFLVIQVIFTWGIGRVRVAGQPARFRNLWVAVAVFSTLMLLLTFGIVLSFGDMTDRLTASEGLASKSDLTAAQLGTVLVAAWLGWLLFAWLSVRNVNRRTAISRLTTTILAGSWVEFSVAFPIELAKRERTQECPCAAGSWWALVICLPILLWSVGPALLLLYRREQRLCSSDSRHALRVVLNKSARSKKDPSQS